MRDLIQQSLFEPLLQRTLLGKFNPIQDSNTHPDIGFIISFVNGEFGAIWDMLAFDQLKGFTLALKMSWVNIVQGQHQHHYHPYHYHYQRQALITLGDPQFLECCIEIRCWTTKFRINRIENANTSGR